MSLLRQFRDNRSIRSCVGFLPVVGVVAVAEDELAARGRMRLTRQQPGS
jgi:hypothetical protein